MADIIAGSVTKPSWRNQRPTADVVTPRVRARPAMVTLPSAMVKAADKARDGIGAGGVGMVMTGTSRPIRRHHMLALARCVTSRIWRAVPFAQAAQIQPLSWRENAQLNCSTATSGLCLVTPSVQSQPGVAHLM